MTAFTVFCTMNSSRTLQSMNFEVTEVIYYNAYIVILELTNFKNNTEKTF